MGIVQGVTDGHEQRAGLFRLERPLALQPRRERLAGDVAHHEIDKARHLAERVQRHDMRVTQARGGACLAPEAFPHLGRARVLGGQHLDGDIAVERELVGQVDGAHPSAPEEALDPVLKTDRLGERLEKRVDRRVRGGTFNPCATRETESRLRRQW